MDRTLSVLVGVGAGAALMYFLDPMHGPRRRAGARDRVRSLRRDAAHFGGKAWRDLSNRSRGWQAETRRWLQPTEPVADGTLVARVRAKLGRALAHPRAVQVDAEEGCITLRGDVLPTEHQRLLRVVRGIPGVRQVVDQLHVRAQTDDVAAVQGGSRRGRSWSPALRTAVGSGAGLLAAYGLLRRERSGVLLGMVATALLVRAVGNAPFSRLLEPLGNPTDPS
jgi:hypothetical protein